MVRQRTRWAIRAGVWLLCASVLSVGIAGRAPADEEGEERRDLPVEVAGTLHSGDAAVTGQVTLRLAFTPLEDLGEAWAVSLRLVANRREVLELDHAPSPPTRSWRKGHTVAYEVAVPLPLEIPAGSELGLYVAFRDPGSERELPPRSEERRYGRRVEVASFPMPDLGPLVEEDAIQHVLSYAGDLATRGRKADAWNALETGLRRSVQDAPKHRFRDALVALGAFEPRPIGVVEQAIVQARIQEERERYLRQVSGRCFDRKQWHAALRILESIGGKLDEQADQAVIGALDQAQRARRDILDLKVRILGQAEPADEEAVRKAVQANGYTKALLDKAQGWADQRRYAAARIALRDLGLNAPDREVAHAAVERQQAVEAAWLADTPPEQAAVVREALEHPAWARTRAVATHKFVYIGPETLVTTIPEQARRRFDLAYVFLTDLFGRLPNPGGDRVTVYFKELWDFGGGVGGGKRIDIGRADPEQKGRRVDNGLLYHELTHCVDDTNPIFHGWREGLANFGAAYAYESLGQQSDGLHSFETNLEAFRTDYLGRDLPYWRIQNYGPSAGFFLHFVEKYAKAGRLHDWKPYRRFFREYREAPVRDGRDPYVARAAAHYLVRAFGPGAFDDLLAFRFPLRPDDREAVTKEVEAFAAGTYGVERAGEALSAHPGSPLPRDLWTGRMLSHWRRQDVDEAERIGREELGVLHDWMVIGPFRERGADPGACVFPPEQEIDFAKEYPGEANVCRWRAPERQGVVTIDPTGWVSFNFNYQEDTATYAITWVTVPEDVDAFLHARADDDLTVFLDDRLVENYLDRGANASSFLGWRGPYAAVPDAVKWPVRLSRGRHELLVKVRNRQGPAGFVLALATVDGKAVPGLQTDVRGPAPEGTTVTASKASREAWKSILRMSFKAKNFGGRLDTAVGRFQVANQVLRGQDTGGGVAWRKYTVRPGFPKDAPSNLLWVKPKITEGLEDLRLSADLVVDGGGAPKVVVTIQGEGGTDGLSGWNLILHPAGKDRVAAQVERYDHLYYQVAPRDLPAREAHVLEVVFRDRLLTVRLDDVLLFDDVPLVPIPGRHRVGIATYGPGLGIGRLDLYEGK